MCTVNICTKLQFILELMLDYKTDNNIFRFQFPVRKKIQRFVYEFLSR